MTAFTFRDATRRCVRRGRDRGRPRLALTLAAALLAGCGSAAHAPSPTQRAALQRSWLANARQLIATLESDVLLTANGGANVATARRALANTSDLFGMALAYTDFADCGKVIRSFGQPLPVDKAAFAALGSACGQVENAAAVFRRAMAANDPRTLVSATRAALAADPLLVRAKASLPK